MILLDPSLAPWRPVLTALVLPPVPFLVLAAWGALRLRRTRRGGWAMVAVALAGIWASQCEAVADLLLRALDPPPPLSTAQVQDLAARRRAGEPLAIVLLGGGVEARNVEYGAPRLTPLARARLDYALWLSRSTGVPLAVTGGNPPAGRPELAEARVAAQAVEAAGGPAARWVEPEAHDTRGNAAFTVPMLARDGVREAWLVTQDWHLPRALRDFERATATLPPPGLRVHGAPVSDGGGHADPLLRWLPSGDGARRVRAALRELLGLAMGA